MLKKIFNTGIFLIFIFTSLSAQQVNSLYFIENTAQRNALNPAFHPTENWFISLPVIGNFEIGLGNNSLTFKDIIFRNDENQTITFLNNQSTLDNFYNQLNNPLLLSFNKSMCLFGAGIRNKQSYWNLTFTQKTDGVITLSKDLFRLAIYGMENFEENEYNFSNTTMDLSRYSEVALGYSYQLNEQFSLGFKPKLLFGLNSMSVENKGFKFYSGIDKISLNADVSYRNSGSFPDSLAGFSTHYLNLFNFDNINGMGAGIDFGFDFKIDDNIRFSASVTDLGFINWYKKTIQTNIKADYQFNGITNLNLDIDNNLLFNQFNDLTSVQFLSDSLLNEMKNSYSMKSVTDSDYVSYTRTHLTLGLEFKLPIDNLSMGVVAVTEFYNKNLNEEITASLIYKPEQWINTAISYSFLKGLSSFGAAVGVKLGVFNLFAAADYIPFIKKNIPLDSENNMVIPVPYNSMYFNFQSGVNILFNHFYPKEINFKRHCNCDWY